MRKARFTFRRIRPEDDSALYRRMRAEMGKGVGGLLRSNWEYCNRRIQADVFLRKPATGLAVRYQIQ